MSLQQIARDTALAFAKLEHPDSPECWEPSSWEDLEALILAALTAERERCATLAEAEGCLDTGLCHGASHVLCCPIALAALLRAGD